MAKRGKPPKGQSLVKCKIRKNDQVIVIGGKDRGKTGRVLTIDRQKGRVVIEGINLVKKAIKPKRQNEKGGISDVENPLSISNVMIVNKDGKKDRIGYRTEDGRKVRICRKSGEQI